MFKRGRRRIKGVLMTLAVLAAVVAAGLYYLRQFYLPDRIARSLAQAIGEYWDGPVAIDRVEFAFWGPVRAVGVSVHDRQGRQWARASAVRFELAGMASLHPVVKAIAIDSPAVTAHAQDGVVRWPVRAPSPERSAGGGPRIELDRLTVTGASLAVADGPTVLHDWQDIHLSLAGGQQAVVTLEQGNGLGRLHVIGTLDTTNAQVNAAIKARRQIGPGEGRAVLALAGVGGYAAEGTLAAHLAIRGSLAQPKGLRLDGTLDVGPWLVRGPDGQLIGRVEVKTDVTGGRLVFRDLLVEVDDFVLACTSLNIAPGAPLQATGLAVAWRRSDFRLVAQTVATAGSVWSDLGLWNDVGLSGREFSFQGVDVQLPMPQPRRDAVPKRPWQIAASPLEQWIIQNVFSVSISDASLTLMTPQGPGPKFENIHLSLSATPKGDWSVWAGYGREPEPAVSIHGRVREYDCYAKLVIRADYAPTPAESAFVLGLAGLSDMQLVRGRFTGEVELEGCLDFPADLEWRGRGRVSDVTLRHGGRPVVEGAGADIEFTPSMLTITDASGVVARQTVALAQARLEAGGPLALRGLKILNGTSPWLTAQEATATVEGSPGASPRITDVSARGVWLDTTAAPALDVGAQSPARRALPDWLDLQSARVDDLALLTDQAQTRGLEGIVACARRDPRSRSLWDFTVERQAANAQGVKVCGRVDLADGQADMHVWADWTLSRREVAALVKLAKVPYVTAGSGRVRMEADVAGRLDAPAGLRVRGGGELSGASLDIAQGPLASGLGCRFEFNQRNVDIRGLRARVLDGVCQGDVSLRESRGGSTDFQAVLDWKDVSFAAFLRVIGEQEKRSGVSHGKVRWVGNTGNLDRAAADWTVMLDDTDLAGRNVFEAVLRALEAHEAIGRTDMVVRGRSVGPVLTVQRGEIANRLTAAEILPGGTVDFRRRTVDVQVIGVPVRQARVFLQEIPLVRILVQVRDKLTRVRVQGNLDDPPLSLVKLEPVGNVTEGTVELLRGTMRAGGQIVSGTAGVLERLLMPGAEGVGRTRVGN